MSGATFETDIPNNATISNISVNTDEDTATSIDLSSYVSDVDGDDLTITLVSLPANGTLDLNADKKSVDYTPNANWNGTELITYTISDEDAVNDNGTLTITVTPVNDAPVAVEDSITVNEDSGLIAIDVIANDTDVEADTLTLTAVSTDGSGTVAVNADGVSVDYTPAADFNGTETITYTVSDGTLTDATGTLTITVTAVNDAPVAVANTLSVAEDASITNTDVIANDTDADGDTLSLTAVTTAGSGTVAAVSYTHLTLPTTPYV